MNEHPNNNIVGTTEEISTPRYFLRWTDATANGYGTTNNWKLEDRAVQKGQKPTAYYVDIEPLDDCMGFRGVTKDRVLVQNGKKYVIQKKIPLYHHSQTRAARIRARTKAAIRFAKLFGFDPNKHIQEVRPGEWTTFEAIQGAVEHHRKNLFDQGKIGQHLNCKKVYGGFVRGRTRAVYLDLDFHGGGSKAVFLMVVRTILGELPGLMEQLGGYGLHHQVANMDARGIHSGFILGRPQDAHETEKTVKEWLKELDAKHPELLKDTVDQQALGYIDPNRPHTHTFGLIEVFPNDHHGFRLPLCWDRTMLLDRPLPLLENCKQDVVAFMQYIECPTNPMKTDDVIDYLQARMGQVETTTPCPRPLKRAAGSGGLTATKASLAPGTHKFVWKYQYRKIIVQFWLGLNCPKGSLDEVIAVHSRIAPYFRTEDEAKAILKQFVREMPEEGWECSSRLAKRDFKRIDKNIDWAVTRAFDGNDNQRDAAESKRKLDEVARRFRQIGFDPFDKATWHRSYSRFKAEVDWLADDLIDFHQKLRPLLGNAKHVDSLDLVNKATGLVLTKEKEENGIALPYWRAFFEDQFGIPCGDRTKRRHQQLVQALIQLGIIAIHQHPMFHGISGEKGLATRYTTGSRLNERLGWRTRLLTEEELLEEVFRS